MEKLLYELAHIHGAPDGEDSHGPSFQARLEKLIALWSGHQLVCWPLPTTSIPKSAIPYQTLVSIDDKKTVAPPRASSRASKGAVSQQNSPSASPRPYARSPSPSRPWEMRRPASPKNAVVAGILCFIIVWCALWLVLRVALSDLNSYMSA